MSTEPGTIIITHQPKSTVPFKIERRDEAGNITDTHSTPTIEHAAEFVVGLARPGDAITGAGEPYFVAPLRARPTRVEVEKMPLAPLDRHFRWDAMRGRYWDLRDFAKEGEAHV